MRRKALLYLSLAILMLVAACDVSPVEHLPTEMPTEAATSAPLPTQNVAAPTQAAPTAVPPTEAASTATMTQGPVPPTITASAAQTVPPATAQPQVIGTATAPAALPAGTPIARLSAGQPITITTLHMLDANTGWAVAQVRTDLDSHILQTTDGAKTWRDVTPPEPASVPVQDQTVGKNAAAFFKSAQDAWVTFGYPPGAPLSATAIVTWATHDGGKTWSPSAALNTDQLQSYWPSDVVFVDDHAGWLLAHVGAGMMHDYVVMYATQDGGATWAMVVDPMALPDSGALAMSCYKSGMIFVDAKDGWVAGNCGGVMPGPPYLYQTMDGGHTWQPNALPAPADAPNLYAQETMACGAGAPVFLSPTDGRIPVSCQAYTSGQNKAWLYVTADGGKTWTARPLPAPYGDLQFLNANQGWWVGGTSAEPTQPRQIYITQDGGQTWTPVKKVNWMGQVDFVDAQTGWAVAKSDQATALVSTSDGGQKWALVAPQVAP